MWPLEFELKYLLLYTSAIFDEKAIHPLQENLYCLGIIGKMALRMFFSLSSLNSFLLSRKAVVFFFLFICVRVAY